MHVASLILTFLIPFMHSLPLVLLSKQAMANSSCFSSLRETGVHSFESVIEEFVQTNKVQNGYTKTSYKELPKDTTGSLMAYSGQYALEVNSFLRGTNSKTPLPHFRRFYDRMVRSMDEIFSSLEPQIKAGILYRGEIRPHTDIPKVGEILSDKAYLSYSVDPAVATSFVGRNYQRQPGDVVFLHITKTSAGHQLLHPSEGMTQYPAEREVLINRQSERMVESVQIIRTDDVSVVIIRSRLL